MRLGDGRTDCTILVDDRPLAAVAGETVAATLMAHGLAEQSVGPGGEPRGLFCGMGVCHDCLVAIDGRAGQRSCLVTVTPGMVVRRKTSPRTDLAGLADLAPLPAGPIPLETVGLAVVGAGPGGLAAAIAAAEAGVAVVVLDERPKPGGQYYKQPAARPALADDAQFAAGRRLIERAQAAGVVFRLGTLCWGAVRGEDGVELELYAEGRFVRLLAGRLVVATGAYERSQAVPGWTLPGVMTTGACQTLVRSGAVAPGRRVLFAGNGPLHLQTATEVIVAGGTVAAVAELAAPLAALRAGLAMAAASPGLAARGLAGIARLRAAGVPLLWRHGLRRIEGEGRAERAVLAPLGPDGRFLEGRDVTIEADAVCLGVGFAPSSELPRLLGCAHEVPPGGTHAEVRRGDDGGTSLPDVWVVGEAGGFGGAQIAEAQGRLAGLAAARSLGRTAPADPRAVGALARARRFQHALWRAFAVPPAPVPDDAVVACRCEGATFGRLRAVARDEAVPDVASLKRLTRAGMGRCQGRYCAAHLAAIVPDRPAGEADLTAPQMPLKPVPVAALAVEKPEWGGHRRALLPPDRAGDAEPLPISEADTVVIGAGVAGLSTAYYLARAGREVVVLDAGRPNAMASGGNAGSLHVQLLSFDFGAKAEAGGSPALRTLPLQRDSVRLWRDLERETGRDFEIAVTGGLMVAETEADLRFLEAKTALERSVGIDSTVIGPADLACLEPGIADRFLGAAWCPEEGKINPLVATPGILAGARAAGARVFDRTIVRALERHGPGFLVSTNRGTIRAGRVVNAAGAFASRIGAMLGLDVPVFGAPLQMIVTEPAAPTVKALVAHADRHLTLKQASNGSFIIGGGWTAGLDPVHHRPRPLRESLEGNLWIAQHVVPSLRKLHVLRSWAAMNINIDGAPILGEHPLAPGFYLAVTSNGYTLGPMVGAITADLVARGRTDRDIAPFAIERFAGASPT
ncbi:FAD-dependent oxidoreductase [Prosthecomicrobium sp. N25]|uniref:FAD-dependent oxidoreductase n=1 Tax=Prosthecomicrobium sp. N25 TaxID=3129254 RepID=UPI00307688F5